MTRSLTIDTPAGPARLQAHDVSAPRALLLLGHGAGGGIDVPDLLAVTRAAGELGVSVGLVEQPYRVAGRRVAAPAPRLDGAWLAVVAAARRGFGPDLPLYVGGRSAGARVACRTAAAVGASGVICLAFPLHPPGRPEKSRLPELDDLRDAVDVLVIQGERDPFGMPPSGPRRPVVVVPGTHRLTATAAIAATVIDWLGPRLADTGPYGMFK